jgi:hypothetical protein
MLALVETVTAVYVATREFVSMMDAIIDASEEV